VRPCVALTRRQPRALFTDDPFIHNGGTAMRIPTIQGLIDRRILVNFRVRPDAMQSNLPPPFRPQLFGGFAIGGICLIRLKHIRPAFLPASLGIGSENAAHRVAVEWEDRGTPRTGVYIPRRDTNSVLNHWAGGRLFPGLHHRARFDIEESGGHYRIDLQSTDGATRVLVEGDQTNEWPSTSVFDSLEDASHFFEAGAVGYSPTGRSGTFEGLELDCTTWRCQALTVREVYSSFFQDPATFPPDSVEFDCALLMTDIQHRWLGRESLCCE